MNEIGDVTSTVKRTVNTPLTGTTDIGIASVTEIVRSDAVTDPSPSRSTTSGFMVWNTNVSPEEPTGSKYAVLPDASAVMIAAVDPPASVTVTETVPPIAT